MDFLTKSKPLEAPIDTLKARLEDVEDAIRLATELDFTKVRMESSLQGIDSWTHPHAHKSAAILSNALCLVTTNSRREIVQSALIRLQFHRDELQAAVKRLEMVGRI